jgi:hypothetical protein
MIVHRGSGTLACQVWLSISGSLSPFGCLLGMVTGRLTFQTTKDDINGRKVARVDRINVPTIRTPKLHQSAAKEWPLRFTTSGAMYSTVPQNE